VLIAEDGTSGAGATGLALPDSCDVITQAVMGSMGYSLSALLSLVGAPQRRHLLFIGDGSFQLTAPELSTILRHADATAHRCDVDVRGRVRRGRPCSNRIGGAGHHVLARSPR